MVASDDDRLTVLQTVELGDEVVVELFRCAGWIGGVEDVTRDDQEVDLVLCNLT